MSALWHLLPYAVQQWYQHAITSSASSSNHSEMQNPDRLAGGVKLDIGNPVALAPAQAGLFILTLVGCRRASGQRRLYVLGCVDADDGIEATVDSASDWRPP